MLVEGGCGKDEETNNSIEGSLESSFSALMVLIVIGIPLQLIRNEERVAECSFFRRVCEEIAF